MGLGPIKKRCVINNGAFCSISIHDDVKNVQKGSETDYVP